MTTPPSTTAASENTIPPGVTAAQIADLLRSHHYRYRNEIDLHRGLEAVLRAAGLDPRPEVAIRGGRIDFIVDRVGIEVKVDGSAAAVSRQVTRYAANPHLDEFLIVTTRTQHRAQIPAWLGDKPVTVLTIGRFA